MKNGNEFSSACAGDRSIGKLALEYCGVSLPLEVLRSGAGFYIGTFNDGPCSRESVEYFPTESKAASALAEGTWTQRSEP